MSHKLVSSSSCSSCQLGQIYCTPEEAPTTYYNEIGISLTNDEKTQKKEMIIEDRQNEKYRHRKKTDETKMISCCTFPLCRISFSSRQSSFCACILLSPCTFPLWISFSSRQSSFCACISPFAMHISSLQDIIFVSSVFFLCLYFSFRHAHFLSAGYHFRLVSLLSVPVFLLSPREEMCMAKGEIQAQKED